MPLWGLGGLGGLECRFGALGAWRAWGLVGLGAVTDQGLEFESRTVWVSVGYVA
jgi:hypothetical protein